MVGDQMGPNAPWLLERLCERLLPAPGTRVLDLGCGTAMTSLFLTRGFDALVHAVDFWMDPDHDWRRAVEAGVADRVCPIRAEAHTLPFAAGSFDAIISIDAFPYLGTDVLYLDDLARFLRPGVLLGVVVPGLSRPLTGGVPPRLTEPQSNGKVRRGVDPFGSLPVLRAPASLRRAERLPGSQVVHDLRNVTSVTGLSEREIEVVTSSPSPLLLNELAFVAIVPRRPSSGTGGPRPAFARFRVVPLPDARSRTYAIVEVRADVVSTRARAPRGGGNPCLRRDASGE